MIDVYSWTTPNGQKALIMLEECGLEYQIHPVNIAAGDQFKPAFLEINPNNKIPAIVDQQGPDNKPLTLFESGAILIYLAEKVGRFLPIEPSSHYQTIQWLMFQMGGLGPMLGQNHHFRLFAPEKIEYAIDRYTKETQRLYGVLDKQLANHQYLVGDEYTIADIASFPWINSWQKQGIELDTFANVKRWHAQIAQRTAVKQAIEKLANACQPTQTAK